MKMDYNETSEASLIKEYAFSDETGDAKATVYCLFPGIEVAYISAHTSCFDFTEIEKRALNNYVGFHYCIEGRIEQEVDNELFYLMPGDLSVVIRDKQIKRFNIPMKHYHGISIGIDTEIAPKKFSEFLGNPAFSPEAVARRLCGVHHSVILRSVEPLKHIFTESYEITEENRLTYLRIKVMELLFQLSIVDISTSLYESVTVQRSQAECVKRIASYIADNMNDKLSLKELTTKFGVSDTYLQKSFRAVYGMPVASFIRAQKMQKAAQVLIHTDRSVDEIAEEFGYINESKFSAVFKKIMGDTPSVYRSEHTKLKIL